MSDFNRRGSRSKVSRDGKISLGLFRNLSCTVTDISNSGARISVGEEQDLPEVFSLRIDGVKRKRKAELRWRNGLQAGVEFL